MALPDPGTISDSLYALAMHVQSEVEKGNTRSHSVREDALAAIGKWEFGRYGYTSPTNILLTAAWVKWMDENQDVELCFINDANKIPIDGSYNGRIIDETFTVRLFSEFSIYEEFCSRNSGFQGSRAIEKHKQRFNRGLFNSPTIWDKEVFFDIMDAINDSTAAEARVIFAYFLELAFTTKLRLRAERRAASGVTFEQGTGSAYLLLVNDIQSIRDPQFHKAVVASVLLDSLNVGESLGGLGGSLTGSDARDRTPGDLWIEDNGKQRVVEGIEVKDPSHSFHYQNLAAARDRILVHPSIETYTLVTTGDKALSEDVEIERWNLMCRDLIEETGSSARAITLRDLIGENWRKIDPDSVVDGVTRLLAEAAIPDIKQGTLDAWLELLEDSSV